MNIQDGTVDIASVIRSRSTLKRDLWFFLFSWAILVALLLIGAFAKSAIKPSITHNLTLAALASIVYFNLALIVRVVVLCRSMKCSSGTAVFYAVSSIFVPFAVFIVLIHAFYKSQDALARLGVRTPKSDAKYVASAVFLVSSLLLFFVMTASFISGVVVPNLLKQNTVAKAHMGEVNRSIERQLADFARAFSSNFEKEIALEPGGEEQEMLKQATSHLKSGVYESAIDAASEVQFKTASREMRWSADLIAGEAYYLLGLGMEAVGYFQDALAINPALPTAYDRLAAIYQSWGRIDEAIELIKTGLSHREDLRFYVRLANIYLKRGELRLAEQSYSQAVDFLKREGFAGEFLQHLERTLFELRQKMHETKPVLPG
jgi:tetratricopeptide (TPR) repeat protein